MSAQTNPDAIVFDAVSYATSAGRNVLDGISFSVPCASILMLLGRSGSGKTTLLKLINRLIAASAGSIYVEQRSSADWDLIRLRRHIGYAIQEVGLFPHYTVAQNIAIVPKLEGWGRARIANRVAEVLDLTGLAPKDFLERYPAQLSGGERQRIGLARALAADPPILLMDEPFGALDPLSRVQLQEDFRKLQQRLKKTVVFVTHDLGEALFLGDRIALLDQGKLRALCSPQQFLDSADEQVRAYVNAFHHGRVGQAS